MRQLLLQSTLSLAAGLAILPAQAAVTLFQGSFAPEAVGATGSGALTLTYDDLARTLAIDASWAGLSGNTTNAHIHCCTAAPRTGTAGVALAEGGRLPGFPLGVTSGSYLRTIDLSRTDQYNGSFLTGSGGTAAAAEARLIANLASGNAYFNIHTSTFAGGEIRAFVTAVPEPKTWALMLAGAGMLAAAVRRRRPG